jgi:hypothetical protein
MAKTLAIVFGIVFVLVGLLGFVSNPLVGMGAIFATNALHNLVHLVIGLILLAVAFWSPMASSLWLKIMGVVYLVVALLGFLLVSGTGDLLGLVTINGADNWLHVVLGVVLLAAGFMYSSEGMGMQAKTM